MFDRHVGKELNKTIRSIDLSKFFEITYKQSQEET